MQPIDFQGIVALDQPLVDQLRKYLQERESQLGSCILGAIHPLPRESLPPILPFSAKGQVHLAEAVEAFGKNVQKISSSQRLIVAKNDWELATKQINNGFWEYVEVLEGCVTELFQQIGQVGFEKWHPELIQVVDAIKEMLDLRLEEAGWKVKRLETLLWDYRYACEAHGKKPSLLRGFVDYWRSLLDRALQSYIKKSRKYLKIRYKWFSNRYKEFHALKTKIEQSLQKFEGYHVFKSMEESHQKDFKNIYRLLKLWDNNLKARSLPAREPVRALRSAFSADKAYAVFKEYLKALKKEIFERSRKFKKDPNELYYDASSRRVVGEVIKGYRTEIHTLGVAIGKYREFFLRTHPNPYVRTRWGFAEWIVGPEPSQTKNLLDLIYEVELYDKFFEELSESLKKGPAVSETSQIARQYREIERTLHEMGQPLTAKSVLRTKAERVLHQLEQINELGSFNPLSVDYVGKALSKALRADWQYHVLFEIPLFHQLYAIHEGIIGPIEDRQHLSRMNKFKDLIEQIQGWVRTRNTHRHIQEIETDMMDMKGCLQDFLAFVQRSGQSKEVSKQDAERMISEIAKQLLQYRYLFGNFFHFLHQHEPEGKLIRNQFLFVDQYFETVENKLHDMKMIWR